MTINDIRKHLENGGKVQEIKDDGREFFWTRPTEDADLNLDKLIELFSLRSAAGMTIYRLV